jgi:Holliday junction DNA helicase RuvB
MSDERIVTSHSAGPEEDVKESGLRPNSFDEYIGQTKVIENVRIMVESAKLRGAALDHLLLSGPPGLGKTSLAMLVAKQLGADLHVISGPAIERKGDIAAVLTNLSPRDVLFIDEIHRMHISVEEILYSAMEDFRLDIVVGQGASARTMQIDLVPFTIIGATTRSGLLSNPLRDRFMAHLNFDYYRPAELSEILANNAKKLGISLEEKANNMIAQRSRGTPRIANRILRRVRDYALINGNQLVCEKEVSKALNLLDIDRLGLDATDRRILHVMKDYYKGGPVGIDALAATMGEDKQTIEEVYEPYLLKEGIILRTSRGRMLSQKALDHDLDVLS